MRKYLAYLELFPDDEKRVENLKGFVGSVDSSARSCYKVLKIILLIFILIFKVFI